MPNNAAPWSTPTVTTQDASTYKTNIDNDFQIAQRIVNNFSPEASETPDLTFWVDAGSVLNGTTLTEKARQLLGPLTMPSAGNKRIDRAVLDPTTGIISVITGTPTSGTPSAPAIPTGKFPIAQIGGGTGGYLTNSTTAITNSMILDERNFWSAPASTTVINSSIAGFLPSSITSSSSTSCTLTVTAGQAADSTNAQMLSGGSFSWSIANGNAANGYQGGTTLASSSTIHFYVIVKSDLSSPASFASTSLTPTLPTGYTSGFYRRIFSLFTNGSGVLLGQVGSGGNAIEIYGGAMLFWHATQIVDVNTSTLSTSRTAFALSLPSGIKVQPLFRASATGTGPEILFTSGDETDVAPTAFNSGSSPLNDMESNSNNGRPQMGKSFLTTNTSAQIGARSSAASTSLWLVTAGFIDPRRA